MHTQAMQSGLDDPFLLPEAPVLTPIKPLPSSSWGSGFLCLSFLENKLFEGQDYVPVFLYSHWPQRLAHGGPSTHSK